MSEAIAATGVDSQRGRSSRLMGAALIVAGTSIGAGMFSLPVVSSGMWFGWSLLLIAVAWYCMYSSGLYLLEVNLQYPTGASFDTMAADTLGNTGRVVNGLSVAFVCYILTYAYISGGGSIVTHSLSSFTSIVLPSQIAGLIFAIGLATFVVVGAKAVDRVTTIMLGGMIISFLAFTAGLIDSASAANLFPALPLSETAPYSLMAIPFVVVSFGYHNCIPSLVKYVNKDAGIMRKAIMIGSGLTGLFYLLWQVSVLGNLGRDMFPAIIAKGGNIGVLIGALEDAGVSLSLSGMLQVFSNLAVATSFLGVALGLFDYLADIFKFGDDLCGRLKTAAIAFVPPTVMGLLVPDGFIAAIGFAGVGATIFCVIVPVLMAMKCRQRCEVPAYQVSGGTVRLTSVLLFGLAVLLLEVFNLMGLLPTFS